MDGAMRRQIVRKFGERVLALPSSDESDRGFAAMLAEWQVRRGGKEGGEEGR